jgi:hypothetical protein
VWVWVWGVRGGEAQVAERAMRCLPAGMQRRLVAPSNRRSRFPAGQGWSPPQRPSPPDLAVWVAAPPSCSWVTSSPVTLFTTSGPVRNMCEVWRT